MEREPYAGNVLDLPRPDRLVNDYACILPESTIKQMEDSLRLLSNKTSNQITVVTVTDLYGYTPNQYATEIGERWGVGQKKVDNGVVILIKPKTRSSKGQFYIATGRGLEGALPDVFCHRIIEDKVIPILKENNDYEKATWAALKVIMPVCRGEYDYETYQDDEDLGPWGWAFMIGLLLVFIAIGIWGPSGGTYTSSGRTSSFGGGGWGSSSSSGGGWGGFGGGSFGGGGAGGSW